MKIRIVAKFNFFCSEYDWAFKDIPRGTSPVSSRFFHKIGSDTELEKQNFKKIIYISYLNISIY